MNATQPCPPVHLRPAGPSDAAVLTQLLAGLSPASSFHRFLAGLAVPESTFARGLLRAEPGAGALLAVIRGATGERALGHACWSVTPNRLVDVGVLVADAAQGRGIGTALFGLAVDAARAAGARTVHLDVHPDNRRLVAALRRRFGGAPFAWEHGLLSVDLPIAAMAGRAAA